MMDTRFRSIGQMIFKAAHMGNIEGHMAQYKHDSWGALDLSEVQISRHVNLLSCKVEGGINVAHANISGDLVLGGIELKQFQEYAAIVADDAHVGGSVYLSRGVKSTGGLSFARIKVAGNFNCQAAEISQGRAPSIRFDGALIQGTLDLSETRLNGQLSAVSAHFGRIVADRMQVTVVSGAAVLASGLVTLNGSLNAIAARLEGEVYLDSARLQGNLDLTNAHILGTSEGVAVAGHGMLVEGRVSFNAATITGRLFLHSARVNGLLSFENTEISCNPPRGGVEHVAITLRQAKVVDTVYATFSSIKGAIDLIETQVGAWRDKKESWPAEIALDGFRYSSINVDPFISVKDRMEWCSRNATRSSAQQPLTELAKYYRSVGNDVAAREVGIHREWLRRIQNKSGVRWLAAVTWSWLLRALVGYGYRPWLILWPFVVLLVVGSIVFSVLDSSGQVRTASQNATGLHFNSFRFTVDLLFPVANFKQRNSFLILGYGEWWVFGFTFLGWFLAFVLLAALTGMFKRE